MATRTAAAIVLTSVRLFGEQREPGDAFTQAELDSLSPNLRGALVREGVLALGGETPEITLSDAEHKAGAKVKKARATRDRVATELAQLREQCEDVAGGLSEKEAERAQLLPNALKGVPRAKVRAEALLCERRDAEQQLSDLNAAITQVEETLAAVEADLEAAEQARLKAEAERLVSERVKCCRAIQDVLADLDGHLREYLALGRQINRAIGPASSAQVDSLWRIEAVIDSALGRHVDPDRRAAVSDFAALEARLLDGALRRAFPDKADRVAA